MDFNMTNHNESLDRRFHIVFALGIIGNGSVIWIAGFRMKKTISAVWFLHLAIADFLCCASLPLRITEIYYLQLNNCDYVSQAVIGVCCIVNAILFSLNMTASVLLLTAMSIDRWVSVMWPFWAKVHRTCKLVRISAAIIWGLSIIIGPSLAFLNVRITEDDSEWCVFTRMLDVFDINETQSTYRLIRLLVMFLIPFLIIVTSYATIFYKIRKSKRPQRSQRSSRIITAVISCFFICWFPYYIWPLTPMFYKYNFVFFAVNILVSSLAFLNSCMNPIIYVFMGQDFQQGFFRSIPARVERALREHPNDLSREDTGNTRSTDV
ncbi:C3a anaphylatoxin chemotactic receptor-like isoform 2-T3 [Anomaloglossus baeobatrachus]|uniref:C3a anaphylatoxin chemotactic receptor-like isoform X3 n=1 Tax=Anomaloglossus baeobatrachus TaxID=238106 RepID=UPI003F5051A3